MHEQLGNDNLNRIAFSHEWQLQMFGLERRLRNAWDAASNANLVQWNQLLANRPGAAQFRLVRKAPLFLKSSGNGASF